MCLVFFKYIDVIRWRIHFLFTCTEYCSMIIKFGSFQVALLFLFASWFHFILYNTFAIIKFHSTFDMILKSNSDICFIN